MIGTDHILTLSQWFSPAFPVGAFAYSHGLEQAIECGAVVDAASLRDWVVDVLRHGSGRADAMLVSQAYLADGPDALRVVDARARAFAASKERLLETVQQGSAFCETFGAVWGNATHALTYPVAVGLAAKAEGIALPLTASMYLQGFCANLISVGVRLIPIGQTDGQRLIRDINPICQTVAQEAATDAQCDLTSTAFVSDIASMKHETQRSRIFRT